MAHVLVICTGNICRSPMAEGFLRSVLVRRFGASAPTVSSAGTQGWEGSAATPEAVEAASEREVDIADHRARRLVPDMLPSADLILAMAGEHRDAALGADPRTADRSFTLKELVRLLDAVPEGPGTAPSGLAGRVASAAALRREGFEGIPRDEDVADPLGQPMDGYRAIAWELDDLIHRLVDGLFGRSPAPASIFGEEETS